MITNAVIRARVNEHIEEEASDVLASKGLAVADAFRMLLTRIANEHILPFEPLILNQKLLTQ
ncbi:TPA: type II toxin-antitoxin system RelB/DinJ family antitoxin [Legionella pneumophila]|uniref:type II toxin-antitoxin system RelB/DinJ family antitoxin n=1 Tax=Legionella pneumophila TaxID=446 RepID=UPI000ABD7B87|nr:type II toxin-antitoxin system RelB/DinJ family antitoxin [Legionella pneumophila]STY00408.1 Antitoxin DinJ [Legionella pneumophila]HBD7199639.1 type II toxin-antitoxin system RelB/DinJ family antitoxin [Legionella pneumophila]HBD9373041.1 type II toxin-antitoxin system RelB/DinJ family antitoxin [Legionella pneumophila]HBP6861081.1 type II toxin-antitoxin system RelB/DinJ family antitoxin [Legionella pneumophila]HCE6160424.1 type II toxin-antitoxin system RelB/DinJ family antitoxin [Legion